LDRRAHDELDLTWFHQHMGARRFLFISPVVYLHENTS
jgi:hypothetical protein